MNYSFSIEDAQRYGVDEAIVLSNFKHWIKKNEANNRHFYEGRTWTYNSAKAFAELFPFWTPRTIQRILTSLEKQGAILSGNFNKSSYDRTKWYAILEPEPFDKTRKWSDANCPMDLRETSNGFTESVQPIPDVNTDVKPDVNTNKKTTPEEPSDKGQAFADWFATLLEETESSLKPAQADKLAWGKEFDKIIRLEAIKEDQLKHICRWARNDPFWRTNFYSPAKLRKKSRDGVKFLTIFIDRAPPMPVERVWDDTLFGLPENGGAF